MPGISFTLVSDMIENECVKIGKLAKMSVNLDGSRELNEPLLVNASGLRKPKKQKSMSMGGLTAIAAIGGFLFG